MSFIKLSKTLPDSKVVEYHKVAEVIFGSTPGIMQIKIGSYSSLEDASSQALPEATFYITMEYTGTYQDALTDLPNKILLLPEWSGGELVEA
jgi:hypothetical protein